MAEVKLRLNLDAEEVELVVDNEVALTSGKDVFNSWVEAHNEKHKPTVTEPVEEKVVETKTEEVVSLEEPVKETEPEEVVAELDNAPAT